MTEHSNDRPPPPCFPPRPLTAHFPHPSPSSPTFPKKKSGSPSRKASAPARAYKLDVQHFMRTLHIRSYDELRQVDHRAVIAWERIMREIGKVEPSTIRRRLAARSSLFKHLVHHGHAEGNRAILSIGLQVGLRRAEITTRCLSPQGHKV
jgi:hypothetical protein